MESAWERRKPLATHQQQQDGSAHLLRSGGHATGPSGSARARAPSSSLRRVYSLPTFTELHNLQSEWEKLPTPLCKHKDHCFQNAMLKGFFRSFAVGYTFKATLSLGNLFFRGKVFKPGVASSVLLGADAIRFGQFLGCMAGSYKAIVCFLRWYTRRRQVWHNSVAAFISALCIVIDDPARRHTMGLYVLIRAIDEILRLLAKQGRIPQYENMNLYAFILSQLPIMLSFVHYPDALNPSYYKWICTMGQTPDAAIRHTFRGAHTPFRLPHEEFRPCHPVFHKNPSCIRDNGLDWFKGWIRAARIYLPVHFLPFLLFRPKDLLSKPTHVLQRVAQGILWSSTFLTTYVFAMKQTMCTGRNILKDDPAWLAVLGGFFTGLSLLFEHKRRHSELALYVIPRALETTYNIFKLDTLLNIPPRIASLAMFQIGLALFLWCYNTDRPHMKGLNESVIRIIFGSPH